MMFSTWVKRSGGVIQVSDTVSFLIAACEIDEGHMQALGRF